MRIRTGLLGMLSIATLSTRAFANPIVDGFWDTQNAEGYTISQDSYIVGPANANTWTGALGIYQDKNLLYLMFAQPTGIVDNSYGTTKVGWSGNGHTSMSDLVGSDKAEFVLKVGSTTVWDGTVDYIETCTNNNVTTYKSGGVLAGTNGCTKSDGSVTTGSASAVVATATSLQWDLNSSCWAGTSGITTNSPSTGSNSPNAAYNSDNPPGCTSTPPAGYSAGTNWLYEVEYEVEIDLNQIANGAYAGMSFTSTTNGGGTCPTGQACADVPSGHDSPQKVSANGSCGALCNTTTTPEPATFALLGTGLFGLGGFARRRRMKE